MFSVRNLNLKVMGADLNALLVDNSSGSVTYTSNLCSSNGVRTSVYSTHQLRAGIRPKMTSRVLSRWLFLSSKKFVKNN